MLWVLGFVLAFCGLFVWLELGCMYPRSGGEKVYLEAVYRRPRFLATVVFAVQAIVLGFTGKQERSSGGREPTQLETHLDFRADYFLSIRMHCVCFQYRGRLWSRSHRMAGERHCHRRDRVCDTGPHVYPEGWCSTDERAFFDQGHHSSLHCDNRLGRPRRRYQVRARPSCKLPERICRERNGRKPIRDGPIQGAQFLRRV